MKKMVLNAGCSLGNGAAFIPHANAQGISAVPQVIKHNGKETVTRTYSQTNTNRQGLFSEKQKEKEMYQIEKGLPIEGRTKRRRWNFVKDMAVNDSFLIPASEKVKPSTIYSTIYTVARRHGIKLTSRVTDEGLRVWRTE